MQTIRIYANGGREPIRNEPCRGYPMTRESDGPGDLRRLLMDRARAQAERDRVRPARQWVPVIVSAVAALGLALLFMLGFDAFLTSMQKFLEVEVTDPEPNVSEPMPAFVVTDDAQGPSAPAEPSAPAAPAEPDR